MVKYFSECPSNLLESRRDERFKNTIDEDLQLADELFNTQSTSNTQMQSLGWLTDQISWRQLPLFARNSLIEKDINQTFETKSVKRKKLSQQLYPVS